MKPIRICAFALLSWIFISCNDTSTDKDTTPASDDSKATEATAEKKDEVSASMRSSFETRFPNATNATWERYKPRDKVEKDDWDYNLDTSDYEVRFRWNDEDYLAWYDGGEWIRAITKVSDHSKLPAAVNAAIKKQYDGFKITEVDKEHDKGMILWEVDLEKGDEKWNIHFSEKGEIVKKKGP